MKQVYGYPNAIYGTNNYVGQPANSIFSTDTAYLGTPGMLSSTVNGVAVSSQGQVTGAASQLPCLNEAPTRHNGIPIERNEKSWTATTVRLISNLLTLLMPLENLWFPTK